MQAEIPNLPKKFDKKTFVALTLCYADDMAKKNKRIVELEAEVLRSQRDSDDYCRKLDELIESLRRSNERNLLECKNLITTVNTLIKIMGSKSSADKQSV